MILLCIKITCWEWQNEGVGLCCMYPEQRSFLRNGHSIFTWSSRRSNFSFLSFVVFHYWVNAILLRQSEYLWPEWHELYVYFLFLCGIHKYRWIGTTGLQMQVEGRVTSDYYFVVHEKVELQTLDVSLWLPEKVFLKIYYWLKQMLSPSGDDKVDEQSSSSCRDPFK